MMILYNKVTVPLLGQKYSKWEAMLKKIRKTIFVENMINVEC